MRFSSFRILGYLLVLSSLGTLRAQYLSGTPEIQQALKRLNVLGTVLMIAAHPDDENAAILAYFARGRNLRTGYLSCTRGEGGQNLIGSEQGALLGLIRTQELLDARKIDGAEQFFTRAIDFGYTKSADETMRKWGREQTLADIVWVIRQYRPDVIILQFTGGAGRDGHGMHSASAILAKEAFVAAADPKRFPEQLQNAKPWQAKRVLHGFFGRPGMPQPAMPSGPGHVEILPGDFNPVLGKSYRELAGISRSMHKSQGEGLAQQPGPSRGIFEPVLGEAATKDVFDGVDTTWNRAGLPEAGKLFEKALREFEPEHPERSIPALLEARKLLRTKQNYWTAVKLAELDEAIALCSGLWADAEADRYTVTPGDTVNVKLTALNRSPYAFRSARARLVGAGGNIEADISTAALEYNKPQTKTVSVSVPASQPYSQPFWLTKPKDGEAYHIDDPLLAGRADTLPVLQAIFEISTETETLSLSRPVRYRYIDRAAGELTRGLVVAPPVAVKLAESVVLFSTSAARTVHVQLYANRENVEGEIKLHLEPGWKSEPAARPFRIGRRGEALELTFQVTPPAAEATAKLRATATVGGTAISSGMDVILYPHIPPQTVFPPAEAKLVRTDVQVTAKRVGYIMGAGDQMPEALRQLGCEVTLLGQSDVEQGNFSRFDAIVTGVRAYNTRADLRANLPRLLDYVKNGGTYLVQYNVMEPGLPPMGPYPFDLSRDRTSMEEMPVTPTDPASPLLQSPNRITARDFDNWVQERGLYFASKWDPRYTTLFESHDPGEGSHPGGTLVARYGKGIYIYSSYSWFRQLPAGVPGGYRIFANLLSAK